jgi:predicted negative regulator of RcsB-dependent stress response
MMWFLDNEILFAVLLIVAAGAILWGWNWWNGLETTAPEGN